MYNTLHAPPASNVQLTLHVLLSLHASHNVYTVTDTHHTTYTHHLSNTTLINTMLLLMLYVVAASTTTVKVTVNAAIIKVNTVTALDTVDVSAVLVYGKYLILYDIYI
jgi:hypothetical protein